MLPLIFNVVTKDCCNGDIVPDIPSIYDVRHSQKTRETSLHTWIILLNDRAISSGHCTCMEGLVEACSHVAAVLFYLNAHPTYEELSCTQTFARWPVPSSKNVDMIRVKDMEWNKKHIAELISMLQKIHKMNIAPALAKVYEPVASKMARPSKPQLKGRVHMLYSESQVEKSNRDLLTMPINISAIVEEISEVEKATRDQSQSSIWFMYRAGRITASNFKSALKARITKPPLSLIKGICYPQKRFAQSLVPHLMLW
ncbi:hypothetical protein NQ315_003501 [Exocentrus adspersus]|uniref:SWIM-type domain-containing protein n=1 Tax=Exocentrus adspersus TaxID=1586481 RepID=A0AAV8V846_9CUCU|nr:hypothetical protein NQ315_003501 [Exocentrus adspersus]